MSSKDYPPSITQRNHEERRRLPPPTSRHVPAVLTVRRFACSRNDRARDGHIKACLGALVQRARPYVVSARFQPSALATLARRATKARTALLPFLLPRLQPPHRVEQLHYLSWTYHCRDTGRWIRVRSHVPCVPIRTLAWPGSVSVAHPR